MTEHSVISHAVAYAHLAGRFFNQPLAITADRLRQLVTAMGPPFSLEVHAQAFDEPADMEPAITGGIAVIPIMGPLVNHPTIIDRLFGFTGYDTIRAMVAAADADERVDGVLYHINSPGGVTLGLFETIASMRQAPKPSVAMIDGIGASAAYGLASAADVIVALPEALVGSIGTIIDREDVSGADAEAKVKHRFFTSGDRKADGNPHAPLTKAEERELEAKIMTLATMLAEAVAAGRVAAGRGTTAKKILALDAAVFLGRDAVAHELVDGVGTVDDAIRALRARMTSRAPSARTGGGRRMTDAEKAAAATAPAPTAGTPSDGTQTPAPAVPAAVAAPAPEPGAAPAAVLAVSNIIPFDRDKERQALRAELAEEQAEIKALCGVAARGDQALATEYLNACLADPKVTRASAVKKLQELQVAASEATAISGRRRDGAPGTGTPKLDPDAYQALFDKAVADACARRPAVVIG